MVEWDSVQYKKFIEQRSQPARDLAMRISKCNPETVVDIGCGPGNSTKILCEIFPHASILGIDSSPNMIKKAKEDNPNLDFRVCDALSLEGKFDIIYSNACFHWIPDHQTFLPALMSKLCDGGCLAVQMPYNQASPLYRIINEMVADSKWGFHAAKLENNSTLSPRKYDEILSHCSSSFDIWETNYYHSLPDHQSLFEWVKGAKLRPYLAFLKEKKAKEFEEEVVKRVEKAYQPTSEGRILFGFNRLFFTAIK